MKKIIFIGLCVLSSFVYGGIDAPYEKINRLHFWEGHSGLLVKMENMRTDPECTRNDNYMLRKSHPYYDEIYSMMLAVRASDGKIAIKTNGCADNMPSIRHVYY